MRLSLLLVTLMILSTATRASADELATLRERIDQLESTVEELTLQLADSVRERRRLEAELAAAVAAAGTAAAAPAATAPVASATTAAAMTAEGPTDREELIEETAVTVDAPARSDAADAAMTGAAAGAAESAFIRSADCDVAQALAGYDGKRKGNEALEAWLQTSDHLTVCSTAQLQQIRDAVKWDWLGYEKPVLQLLDKELARR
jgi:hypothetical protein